MAAASLAAACSLAFLLGPAADLPRVPGHAVELSAVAVSTLDGRVTARRLGRVLALRSKPGDAVAVGDPLVEFQDLGLLASKSELDREISALLAKAATAPPAQRDAARAGGQELRRATVRHLEESFETARKDFERWRILHEEGLVARLEFERKEREFTALGKRLKEARASAEQDERGRDEPAEARVPPDLRRAERLRAQLEKLPRTFVAASPWDGTVRELHVEEGEEPLRGAALATVARAALQRLEASVGNHEGIAAVRSACGMPGPFPFTIRKGILSVTAPVPAIRPGDRCEVVVWARK